MLCLFLTLTVLVLGLAAGVTPAMAKKAEKKTGANQLWPLAEGNYVRKNANGVVTGSINIFVRKKNIPRVLAWVECYDYAGNNKEEVFRAPGIIAAGTFVKSEREMKTSLTRGVYLGGDGSVTGIPPRTDIAYRIISTDTDIALIPFAPGLVTDTDLAGHYVKAEDKPAVSPFMALAWVEKQDAALTGIDPSVPYSIGFDFVGGPNGQGYADLKEIPPSILVEYAQPGSPEGSPAFRRFLVFADMTKIFLVTADNRTQLIYEQTEQAAGK